MKDQYKWNYTIRVKTKDGTYEYEEETLDNIENIIKQHKDYEELKATHKKPLTKTKRMNRKWR